MKFFDFENFLCRYWARAVKVNSKKREILVHFDGWGSRFDEWLPTNSPRIRVPPPDKTKKEKVSIKI